jgi:CRISPR/Cas system CSM-associated protein Csm5 (group 7 of RAMP superfamily)
MKNGYHIVDRHENHSLLHLGYGTGFEGTTALFYFLLDKGQHTKQKRQLLARIMERFNIGKPPGPPKSK